VSALCFAVLVASCEEACYIPWRFTVSELILNGTGHRE
jgi:hypothetical protein